jgi:hypothetical protein
MMVLRKPLKPIRLRAALTAPPADTAAGLDLPGRTD